MNKLQQSSIKNQAAHFWSSWIYENYLITNDMHASCWYLHIQRFISGFSNDLTPVSSGKFVFDGNTMRSVPCPFVYLSKIVESNGFL